VRGYWGVEGQDVGQLHLEASFGDRALLLEFESGFFGSREEPAGAQCVRDAAAGAEPVQRRDLRRGPRSACTGRHGLVITSAVAVVAPAGPSGTWSGRGDDVGCHSRTGCSHRVAVHQPRRRASLSSDPANARRSRRAALPTPLTSPQRDRLAGSLPVLCDSVDELTSCEVELSPRGWLSPGSAHGRSPERDPLPSPRPMDRCENRHAGAGGSGRGEPE
jgi:hypothetical protein